LVQYITCNLFTSHLSAMAPRRLTRTSTGAGNAPEEPRRACPGARKEVRGAQACRVVGGVCNAPSPALAQHRRQRRGAPCCCEPLGAVQGFRGTLSCPRSWGTAPRRDTPQVQVGPTSGPWRGTPDDALAGVRGRAVSDVLGGPHTATKRWPSPGHHGVVHASYPRRLSWHAHDADGYS
jgi:hypothetical protein